MKRSVYGFGLVLLACLLAACGGGEATPAATTESGSSDNQTADSGSTIQISGHLTRTLNTNFDSVQPLDASTAGADGLMLYLNQDSQYVVFFQLPPDIQPGTYTITNGIFDGTNVTATYIDNDETMLTFAVTEGTLTLDTVGERYSGSFEFTAQGGDIGPLRDMQITVTGTFRNIELQESASG